MIEATSLRVPSLLNRSLLFGAGANRGPSLWARCCGLAVLTVFGVNLAFGSVSAASEYDLSIPTAVRVGCTEPCVTVDCTAPTAACDGEEIVIDIIVTNCSDGPEDVEVYITRPTAEDIGPIPFPDLAPGETRFVPFRDVFECGISGGRYFLIALVSNDCGAAEDLGACTIGCSSPCVAIACTEPPAACDGQEIIITGTAFNCSYRPEDIEVEFVAPDNTVIGRVLFPEVGAGEVVEFQHPVQFRCPDGETTFRAFALATNDCGQRGAEDVCVFQCNPRPCLAVACEAPPMGEGGQPIPIHVEAINCSPGPEDISITVLRPNESVLCTQFFAGVSPGDTLEFLCDDILECPEGGGTVVYTASAMAINACGETEEVLCEQPVECDQTVPTVLKLFDVKVENNGIRLLLELNEDAGYSSALIHRGTSGEFKYASSITPKPLQLSGVTWDFVDETVTPESEYWYWVELQEVGRTPSIWGPVSAVSARPGFTLTYVSPVQPNPTPGSAVFRYTVGSDIAGNATVPVFLSVYDSRGRLVRSLASGRQTVGEHTLEWDGRNDAGARLSAGVYYYRFRAGTFDHRASLVLLR